jgi:hypothetical protein
MKNQKDGKNAKIVNTQDQLSELDLLAFEQNFTKMSNGIWSIFVPDNNDIDINAKFEQSPIEYDENHTVEDEIDGLRFQINWEQNEKARNLIESGDINKYTNAHGNGEQSAILRALMGDDEQRFNNEMNRLGMEAQKRHPEIFLCKVMRKEKMGICQHTVTGPNLEKPTYITKEQFIDFNAGFTFANGYGVPLNVHVTINWGLLGYLDHCEAAEALQEQFIDHMTSWYNSNYHKFDLHIPPEL